MIKLIQTIDLCKTYVKRVQEKVYALKHLNLEIKKGEIFGFLGPNGAGKSTTIKLILDIIRPTSGKAFLFDIDISNPESRRRVGYLPENPSFYDYLTAEELLWFAGRIHKMDDDTIARKTEELLALLDLTEAKSTPIRKYSKGMVQRAGLAHSLINNPDLLILDEPTSGLDPVGRRKVADLLLDLKKQGKTIFFSSHILHDVETICDKVGIIVDGEMQFCGKLSEVLHQSLQGFEVVVQNVSDEKFKEILDKEVNCHREGDTVRLMVEEGDLSKIS